MMIPDAWAQARGEARTRDGKQLQLTAWGWGENPADAQSNAGSRLSRMLERVRRGEPLPRAYDYGLRPLREEVHERFAESASAPPYAVITRNRYGALILNTTRLLFLDVDLPPASTAARLRWLLSFGRADPARATLDRLRETLARYARASFRLYRTAAGFRAIAIDRDFDPSARDTLELMEAAGADPAFVRLCRAQKSFRARLTPKPWRAECKLPPGQFPRSDPRTQQHFETWLHGYQAAGERYASCRFLETIGGGHIPRGRVERLIALHDEMTRSTEKLTLA